MADQDPPAFPIVCSFDASGSEDGSALLVQANGFDGSVLRFAIPIDNVKYFISFLLMWVGTISSTESGRDKTDLIGLGTLPIPATSIAIGEPSGKEGYIGISVGRAELVFSLPISAFHPIAQTLLLAGMQPSSTIS
jgi:hypothetical protein